MRLLKKKYGRKMFFIITRARAPRGRNHCARCGLVIWRLRERERDVWLQVPKIQLYREFFNFIYVSMLLYLKRKIILIYMYTAARVYKKHS